MISRFQIVSSFFATTLLRRYRRSFLSSCIYNGFRTEKHVVIRKREKGREGEKRFIAVLFKKNESFVFDSRSDNYVYFSYYQDKGVDRDNAAGLLSIIRYFGDN